MKVSIEEAINMASNGQSLEGVVIEDLGEAQVKAMDALMLSTNFLILLPKTVPKAHRSSAPGLSNQPFSLP